MRESVTLALLSVVGATSLAVAFMAWIVPSVAETLAEMLTWHARERRAMDDARKAVRRRRDGRTNGNA